MNLTKYFRNISSLEYFRAFVNRLDPFWIGVEYFNNSIEFDRKIGNPLQSDFKDRFFTNVMADAIRSSLDVFSKSIAWYFDIPGRETIGFGYETLIKPLSSKSKKLAEKCNDLYKSEPYRIIKEFRDADRHTGNTNFNIREVKHLDKFDLTIERVFPVDLNEINRNLYAFLNSLIDLVQFTVVECKRWPLGFNSQEDKICEITEQGWVLR